MKIAHISDLHYCSKNLKWLSRAMDSFFTRLHTDKPAACVISGDSFDHAMSLQEPPVTEFFEVIRAISSVCPVAILSGTLTHDPDGCFGPLRTLVDGSRVLVIDRPGVWLLDKDGRWADLEGVKDISPADNLLLLGLPSLNKAQDEVVRMGARGWVELHMEGFRIATNAALAQGVPSMLTTHGTIDGTHTESKYAMIGPDHEFTQELLFSSGADVVAIGHIHAHQVIHSDNFAQTIAYPGSFIRMIHGDVSPKGWIMWSFNGAGHSHEFIPSPSRIPMDISFDSRPDMDQLEVMAAEVTEDHAVRITWHVDAEYSKTVDQARIRALFKGAESIRLRPVVYAAQSVRSAEVAMAHDVDGRVKAWLSTTGDLGRHKDVSRRLTLAQSKDIPEILSDITSK